MVGPLNRESESIKTSEQVTLGSLQEGVNDQDVTSPEVQIPQESKAKRSKKSQDEVEIEEIKSALLTIVFVFRESTTSHDKYFKENVSTYGNFYVKCKWKVICSLQYIIILSNILKMLELYLDSIKICERII
ncbi:unnamed protein product [Vicia faba]|uniref:Uncharacterized protein n=1 Tax=Vicia faba TaxID=3906 RepID=A0AAV1B9K3_VICFA|nr:unnamed protein product [Vicia faba]